MWENWNEIPFPTLYSVEPNLPLSVQYQGMRMKKDFLQNTMWKKRIKVCTKLSFDFDGN